MEASAALNPQAETPTIDQFNAQLERYERILNAFEGNLGAVLFNVEGPEESTVAAPREAPQSRLHNCVLELERLNDRAERLRSRVRL